MCKRNSHTTQNLHDLTINLRLQSYSDFTTKKKYRGDDYSTSIQQILI